MEDEDFLSDSYLYFYYGDDGSWVLTNSSPYLNDSSNLFYDVESGSYELTANEWRTFIMTLAFYVVVFVLGVTGNCLVIYCIARYKRMKSITNQLLMSLACADLLLVLVCIPIKFAELFSFGWTLGETLCKLTHYVQTWSMVTSIATLTVISIERYYAISRPLRAKYLCSTNHIRYVIIAVWILSGLLALPTLFVQDHHRVGLVDPVFWCEKGWHYKGRLAAIAYESYMLLLLFLLPVMTMVFSYSKVCMELWAVTGDSTTQISEISRTENESGDLHVEKDLLDERSTSLSQSEECDKSTGSAHQKFVWRTHGRDIRIRKQVLRMLVIVVLVFVFCWGPLLCYNMAVATELIKPYLPTIYPYAKTLNTVFSLLSYCNSCLNPIVYGFMSRYFRKSFKQALSSCCILSDGQTDILKRAHRIKSYQSSTGSHKPCEVIDDNDSAVKRNTMSTTAADSTLSRSAPVSPSDTLHRNSPKLYSSVSTG